MKLIKTAVMYFTAITTGTLLANAVFLQISNENAVIHVSVLWQIILIAVLGTLGSMLAFPQKEMSRMENSIRIAAHFVFINLLVLGLGWYWDWVDITNVSMVIVMVIAIGAVYGSVFAIAAANNKRLAEQINEKLKEYSDDE